MNRVSILSQDSNHKKIVKTVKIFPRGIHRLKTQPSQRPIDFFQGSRIANRQHANAPFTAAYSLKQMQPRFPRGAFEIAARIDPHQRISDVVRNFHFHFTSPPPHLSSPRTPSACEVFFFFFINNRKRDRRMFL